MPGPVSSAHQQYETQCSQCHVKFDRQSQNPLCLDCHEDVGQDRLDGVGFHGREPNAKTQDCNQCHTEHKGRDADVVGLVPELFDHSLTDFPLEGQHADTTCDGCHSTETDSSNEKFSEAPTACIGCHESEDAHQAQLGTECESCHNASRWSDTSFDHDQVSDFALTGAHQQTPCAGCHTNNQYEGAPSACQDCHEKDDVHNGTRGMECQACHTTQRWDDATFDHAASTGFDLVGRHADLACEGCHLKGMSLENPPTTCIGCHSNSDRHLGKNGTDCGSCHQQNDWGVSFNHELETDFALRGAHATLQCESCHKTSLADPLETNCYACHFNDDPHKGELTACEDCHEAHRWSEDIRFHHDLTAFPLVGGHRSTACEQCHAGLAFGSTADATCVDCHRSTDIHDGGFGDTCTDCHSPAAWELWQFEHDQQTEFALTGEHKGLACASCHTPGDTAMPGQACVGCHRGDDIHGGSFGVGCNRCHTTESFSSPQIGRLR